jgi:trehalose utilization protein
MANKPIRVTVGTSSIHERMLNKRGRFIPTASTRAGRGFGSSRPRSRSTATLDQPEHGLTAEVLSQTDVLTWWGHAAHDQVSDAVVERVHQRVLEGMGFLALHSTHASKIFRRMMGTSCMLRWREAAEKERIWIIDPSHPIVDGLQGEFFELPQVEMYGEFFDIPRPDELITISWFEEAKCSARLHFPPRKGKIFHFSRATGIPLIMTPM